MIFIRNITKSFGTQVLFDAAGFQVNKGERIGIVGRNGSGKTTLFRLILATDAPDDGEVSVPENYRIGVLDQQLKFSEPHILAEVCKSLSENEKSETHRAKKLLSGLGFSPSDFLRSANEFSGGFQIRVKLAELLLSAPDLLLLDEPTNYLDILSLRWLEKFLQTWKHELLCISHDQTFLEKITTHTVAIHRQKFKKISGGPEKIYAQIAQEEDIYEKTRCNEEKNRVAQEKFIREFRSGARSAGLVQSRIKMLEKKGRKDALTKIPPIKFHFSEIHFNATKLGEICNLKFGYEEGIDLMKKISFEIFPHDKIGIIGQNGKGKSTLLNLLAKNLMMTGGTIKYHVNTHFGYFGQSNVERLEAQKTILESLMEEKGTSELKARSVAGNLLFSGDLANKKIENLSGGEKARVNLGKIFIKHVNLLFLDEPTNHLDIESVESLILAVKRFSGGAVFVSHNEKFLRECAQKLIVFDEDTVFLFSGTYDEFLAQKGFVAEQTEKTSELEKWQKKQEKPVHRKHQKEKERLTRPLKRMMETLEKEIAQIEKKQAENKENFKIVYRQGNLLKMETLGIEYQELQKMLEEKLETWSRVGEEVEKIERQ